MCFYFSYVAFFRINVDNSEKNLFNFIAQVFSTYNNNLYDGCKIYNNDCFKNFIADNLAEHIDFIFTDYLKLSGGLLWLGGLYFSIQIYWRFLVDTL